MMLALFLLIATAVTGCCAVVHRFLPKWMKRIPTCLAYGIEQLASFFSVFLFVLILRSFLIEPFRIPSGSLEPTLLIGDFVAVNKFSYGLRLPYFETKFLSTGLPKRGDVVVFRWPPNERLDYIKRVIGIPGDTVAYHDKQLTVNGQPLTQTTDGSAQMTDQVGGLINVISKTECVKPQHCHKIYVDPEKSTKDFTVRVPKGYYFVMGDNRDYSSDSRYWGFVPEKDLKGKAFLVWLSWDSQAMLPRWSRIGKVIR